MEDASLDPLIRDLLEWISRGERTYQEVMEAWRRSCPKLPVWEEANLRGFITNGARDGRSVVALTAAGRAYLEQPSIGSEQER